MSKRVCKRCGVCKGDECYTHYEFICDECSYLSTLLGNVGQVLAREGLVKVSGILSFCKFNLNKVKMVRRDTSKRNVVGIFIRLDGSWVNLFRVIRSCVGPEVFDDLSIVGVDLMSGSDVEKLK